MWPANAATGPHQEARENDGLLYEAGRVVGHGEEAAQERWYYSEKADVKDLFEAGGNESSTAERSGHPGYSRFETRSFDNLDWRRDVTIVSPLLSTYNNVVPSLSASFTQALRQLLAPLCVLSILIITVIHLLLKSFSKHSILFCKPLFVAWQPAY
jgi:hypothetical protein